MICFHHLRDCIVLPAPDYVWVLKEPLSNPLEFCDPSHGQEWGPGPRVKAAVSGLPQPSVRLAVVAGRRLQ